MHMGYALPCGLLFQRPAEDPPADTENATLLCYKAQALSARAWAYHMLVQLFATPYSVNPQARVYP